MFADPLCIAISTRSRFINIVSSRDLFSISPHLRVHHVDRDVDSQQDPLFTWYVCPVLPPSSKLNAVLVRYHLPHSSQSFTTLFSSTQSVYVHPSTGGEDEDGWGSIYLKTVVQGVLMARYVVIHHLTWLNLIPVRNYTHIIPPLLTSRCTFLIREKRIYVNHDVPHLSSLPLPSLRRYGRVKV